MRKLYAIGVLLLAAGCSSPTNPSPAVPITSGPVQWVTYSINIPEREFANTLQRAYPNGIQMAPAEAQRQFDYTWRYGGSPNVYVGDVAPVEPTYLHTGIVVAPRNVADMEYFRDIDWPQVGLAPHTLYGWLGRFEYTQPAPR